MDSITKAPQSAAILADIARHPAVERIDADARLIRIVVASGFGFHFINHLVPLSTPATGADGFTSAVGNLDGLPVVVTTEQVRVVTACTCHDDFHELGVHAPKEA